MIKRYDKDLTSPTKEINAGLFEKFYSCYPHFDRYKQIAHSIPMAMRNIIMLFFKG